MFLKMAEVEETNLGEGVTRKILASGGTMMIVQFVFEKGAVGTPHTHPHEQVGYALAGRFELTFENQITTIETGDTYYVPSNTLHGVVALKDGVLLDVFTRRRGCKNGRWNS
jgi:quercetin dioxygenase-like cupin family protein